MTGRTSDDVCQPTGLPANLQSQTFRSFEIYIVVAGIYLALALLFSLLSIGGFGAGSSGTFAPLDRALADRGIDLLIENDQTVAAGTIAPLRTFFAEAQAAGLPLGMTFDMGNWHWTGECALEAARTVGSRVAYVHCKGVQRQPQRWVAVPLADSAAPWRTVLRLLPRGLPWAIEYPLQGEDLLAVTREQVALLRDVAVALREPT